MKQEVFDRQSEQTGQSLGRLSSHRGLSARFRGFVAQFARPGRALSDGTGRALSAGMIGTLFNAAPSVESPVTRSRATGSSGVLFVATQPLATAWSSAIAESSGERHAVRDLTSSANAAELLDGDTPWLLVGVCADQHEGLNLLHRLWATDERALVFLVTTRGDARVGAALLNAGADFWLPSDVGPELIASCIVAARRRRELQRDASLWRSSLLDEVDTRVTSPTQVEFALDPRTMTLRIGQHLARLSAAEFKICAYLVRNSERWVLDAELRRAVFNPRASVSDSLVRVHVHKIRKALGNHHQCVQSKRHMGYRFVPLPTPAEHACAVA